MRGALHQPRHALGRVRIIPADAGSTSPYGSSISPHRDHPRGCGEHSVFQMRGLPSRGSSPRMRGAPGNHRAVLQLDRIIPADAGSTRIQS